MIQAASDLDLYSPQGLGDFLFDDDKPDYILNQNNDAGNGMDEILNAAWKDLFEFDCTLGFRILQQHKEYRKPCFQLLHRETCLKGVCRGLSLKGQHSSSSSLHSREVR